MEPTASPADLGRLTIAARGEAWGATVETYSGRNMRVAVRPAEGGALPQWPSGSSVECAIDMDDGRYRASATVVKQVAHWVWLRVPAWESVERRASRRVPANFPVNYSMSGVVREALCTDIGAGGIRMRVADPISRWMRMALDFDLPGDLGRVQVEGVAVYAIPVRGEGLLDVGVKFVGLPPEDGARIARFCRAAAEAEDAADNARAAPNPGR